MKEDAAMPFIDLTTETSSRSGLSTLDSDSDSSALPPRTGWRLAQRSANVNKDGRDRHGDAPWIVLNRMQGQSKKKRVLTSSRMSTTSLTASQVSPECAFSSMERTSARVPMVMSPTRSPIHRISTSRKTNNHVRPHPLIKKPRTLNIDGKTFTLLPAFDKFWKYASERQIVEENRRMGKPQEEWSDGDVFRYYKFCCVFRVADRGCQFLITNVIEKGSQEDEEVLFRVLLYSTFMRVDTYELLEEDLGPLSWKTYDRKAYVRVLRDAQDRGQSIYTGSFQKMPPILGCKDACENHLMLLEAMMEDDMLGQLKACGYMADAFDVIFQYPNYGDFLSFQLLLNLSYTPLVNFSENDFVIAGKGAVVGLKACFSPKESVSGSEPELIRWMTETQEEHFERLGLKPARLGKRGRKMTLVDVEHTLCELQKYLRIVIKGGYGKKFTPESRNYLRWPVLPRAWDDPARRKARPKPFRASTERSEKVFVVQDILDRDETEDGEVIYFVQWMGYDERSWEPEKTLREDAPAIVEEYESLFPRHRERNGKPKQKMRKRG